MVKADVRKQVARGKGRPSRSSDLNARNSLMAAAKEMLKTQAPSKINRLELAQNAGVDPALLRYYFGNKDALLLETASDIVKDMRRKRRAETEPSSTFEDKLRLAAYGTIDLIYRYPHLDELLIQQISVAHESKADDLREVFVGDPYGEIKQMLEQAIAAGEVRDVETTYFYVALVGMCSFAMSHRALLSQLMGVSEIEAGVAADYARFVVDLVMRGVATAGAGVGPRDLAKPQPRRTRTPVAARARGR